MSWMFKDSVVTMKEIMSWLLKDPINSGLAQFDHAQLNSKKWPKGKKTKLSRMNFFLEKQLIKFSCTFWPLSLCKILKTFLGPIQSYEMCHFQVQNSPFVLNNIFLVQTIIITFIYLLALFIVQNFKNVLPADPEFWVYRKPFNEPCFFQLCLSTCHAKDQS